MVLNVGLSAGGSVIDVRAEKGFESIFRVWMYLRLVYYVCNMKNIHKIML